MRLGPLMMGNGMLFSRGTLGLRLIEKVLWLLRSGRNLSCRGKKVVFRGGFI